MNRNNHCYDFKVDDYGPMQVIIPLSRAAEDWLGEWKGRAFGMYLGGSTGRNDGLVFDLAEKKTADAFYDCIAAAKVAGFKLR